jgi:hypothetical protein
MTGAGRPMVMVGQGRLPCGCAEGHAVRRIAIVGARRRSLLAIAPGREVRRSFENPFGAQIVGRTFSMPARAGRPIANKIRTKIISQVTRACTEAGSARPGPRAAIRIRTADRVRRPNSLGMVRRATSTIDSRLVPLTTALSANANTCVPKRNPHERRPRSAAFRALVGGRPGDMQPPPRPRFALASPSLLHIRIANVRFQRCLRYGA